MTSHHRKAKAIFAHVVLYGIAFLISDVVIALSPFKPVLIGLGILEIVAMGWLVLQAAWNSLPKGVQKGMKKL